MPLIETEPEELAKVELIDFLHFQGAKVRQKGKEAFTFLPI
jgi:hypothetical protein